MTEDLARQLCGLLDDLDDQAERCRAGLLLIGELGALRDETARAAAAILPADSDADRLFRSRWERLDHWMPAEGARRFVAPPDCRKIEGWIAVVREVAEFLDPDAHAARDERYFSPGEVYPAKRYVLGLMRMATKDLLVVDPFMNETVLDFVADLDPGVRVRLVTGGGRGPNKAFDRLYAALRPEHPNLEARRDARCHDRWILVDDSVLWHLGASIEHIGHRATRISRVRDQAEYEKACRDMVDWWEQGAAVAPPD